MARSVGIPFMTGCADVIGVVWESSKTKQNPLERRTQVMYPKSRMVVYGREKTPASWGNIYMTKTAPSRSISALQAGNWLRYFFARFGFGVYGSGGDDSMARNSASVRFIASAFGSKSRSSRFFGLAMLASAVVTG